ncbi:glycosyl transferase, group 1 [Aeropyrum pernix K1]|uniref:Glycosyl transferase, group 1 n=1 Tax=Aeropyrum pernix (strain ATCC 700893 / DSM 11879 / JCM 9820 / NBRC 100138 / K1) TaxID=272557 RepID=Q9YCS0_AERPE|nr:glycosyltransferase family 4 protein [Aeropyrum pernix]BAA80177.1 glycosyl transferase, group 1 [Aeropyrum pernix K1]
MRILWINHRDPKHPQAGGAEVRLYEIARRLVKMGHEVMVLCEKVSRLPGEEVLEGIRIKRSGGRASIHLLAPLYVRKHGHEYDVIVDDIAHAVPWYSPLVTKTPVVAQIHHVHQDVVYIELPKPLAWIVSRAEKTIAKIYRRFIAVSQSTKKELAKRLGIDPDRIAVVPNGVDLEKYRPGSKDPRPTILWAGRIKMYKNLDHLLKAYRIVKQEIPDAQLIIIGTGDQEQKMRELAKKLEPRDVHFLGKMSEQEKIMWMQRAWIIVSTSMIEGWGITITEAAACKIPAIAYNVPGLRDSVKHMETGILVEPGNIEQLAKAIAWLLTDNSLRNKLSENAYNYAQSFSWDNTAITFLNILEDITRI